jgi:hypothetical protein
VKQLSSVRSATDWNRDAVERAVEATALLPDLQGAAVQRRCTLDHTLQVHAIVQALDLALRDGAAALAHFSFPDGNAGHNGAYCTQSACVVLLHDRRERAKQCRADCSREPKPQFLATRPRPVAVIDDDNYLLLLTLLVVDATVVFFRVNPDGRGCNGR